MTNERPTRVRFCVLLLLALVAVCAYLTRHCIAVANTSIQQDLGLDERQMGWALGAFSIGYFVCQIPGGWLGNRIGTRAAFSLLSVLWSLCTAWTALSSSYLPLLASRIASGLAQAGLVPLSSTIVNDWFPVSRRGTCSSVITASMSIGGLVTMGLTARLMTSLHWRQIFYLYALVGIVWSVAFYVCFRTRPEDHPWANDEEVRQIRGTRPNWVSEKADIDQRPLGADSALQVPSPGERWRLLFCCPTIWGIYLQAMFKAAGYALFVTWFPAYLEYRYSMSPHESGHLTMYPLASSIVGTLCGGVLIDWLLVRTASKRLSRTGVACAALGLCGALAFSSSLAPSAATFVILMSTAVLCSGAASPAAWAATMDVSGPSTSLVFGAMNMASTFGGFVMPVVLGYLIGNIQSTGGDWNQVVYVIAAVNLAAALSWLAVDPEPPSLPRAAS